MRLSGFIRAESENILKAWDEFAATVSHGGHPLDQQALRDHAGQILLAIADDIEQPQSDAEQMAKSRGLARRDAALGDTPAETHADTRIVSGFAVDAMLTEYRALRASVLRLWARSNEHPGRDDIDQMTRFNEAVDQAITESVSRYANQVERNTNLFMGMVGHDIRNPLGTIRLSAEVLVRTGQLSAKAAGPIVNGARRIEGIIEQIVDFTRGQANGIMPLRPGGTDLAQTFADVVGETRVRHPEAVIRIDTHGELAGAWDTGRLSQLLSNLLENALTYGARQQPVSVRLDDHGDEVRFSVHNFGRPIPPAERHNIFEPRVRGTGYAEHLPSDGLGLGLYICREIVRAHRGTLSVRSEPDEGTTFTVRLPRHANEAAEALAGRPAGAS